MRRVSLARFAAAVAAALALPLALAETPAPPKPGPEHAKLAEFVGSWDGQADVKESPLGPAGKMTWTETCNWFDGGFHLVCKSSGQGPAGKTQGLSILGWSADTASYTYYGIDSTGWFDFAEGSVSNDTWTWGSERLLGGDIVRSRYIVRQTTPTSHTFTFEMQREGGGWTLVMEGLSKKAK